MGSPYRERPRYLLCPRCGEMLERAFEGVSTCLRCEGVWIGPATLDAAFGNPRWPGGQALWWRNAIDCPECAFEGKQTLMSARMSSDVIVDQCPEHGVWLDRGELGRLMGGAVDELEALRQKLAVGAPAIEQLGARREQWRARLETRRKAAADDRRELAPTPAPPLARSGERPGARDERTSQRAQASAELARLKVQLGVLREHIEGLETELAGTRQRATSIEHELDAARGRLRLLDDELAPER
jgi:Zn-finger nucleic acid-binding protein